MKVIFDQKISDKNIDRFIDGVFSNYKENPKDHFFFDLTEVEHIGNQELLVLTALLKIFYKSKVEFEVEFFKKGVPSSKISTRVKMQIIQIWEVWQIHRVVPNEHCAKYFGIDGNTVQRLQSELKYFPKQSELYTRHGITPFVALDFINNYSEPLIRGRIEPIYKLNSVIEKLLHSERCHHPFTSKSLSTIITEELYLNFLDHSEKSSFNGLDNLAFMSISFQGKLTSGKDVQTIKKINFETECVDKSVNFYYDKSKKIFKNFPYIQFSFLDFGTGISNSLKEEYLKEFPNETSNVDDSKIIKYAFDHHSSRHPIKTVGEKDIIIPRGLFDAFTIVKRYRGLLVVRSNRGKVLFDFSTDDTTYHGIEFHEEENTIFPGTLISIYIPALEGSKVINESTIKPALEFKIVHSANRIHINFTAIADRIEGAKRDLYNQLFSTIKSGVTFGAEHALIFVNFEGTHHIEKRILRKALYFFLTDYEINHQRNIIIVNFLDNEIFEEIEAQLRGIDKVLKNYKVHPLPFITWNFLNDTVSLRWLGVFNNEDKLRLSELLYGEFSITRTDLIEPEVLSGHVIDFDEHGNLVTNLITDFEINHFLVEQRNLWIKSEIFRLIAKHNCIMRANDESIFLSNGNYYQHEFLELTNLVYDKIDCQIVSRLLFDSIAKVVKNCSKYKFIAITSASQRIVKSFILQGLIITEQGILLDNYHSFEDDNELEKIEKEAEYILICDVISTGYLTQRLCDKLLEYGASLSYIGVIADTASEQVVTKIDYRETFKDRLINLVDFPINKYKKETLGASLLKKDVIRINPFTNIPISFSLNETKYSESVIFPTDVIYTLETNTISIDNKFLDQIDETNILVGFINFNNLIHPYFFDTQKILDTTSEEVIDNVFKKINKPYLRTESIKMFYPRRSGIEKFSVDKVRNVLMNDAIEEVEIERFGTPDGWRFPHNSNYLGGIINNHICIILDDGSCSGDSLFQMIDEIAFYNAKEIILICVIGRVNDHKREFFSRLSQMTVKDGVSVNVSVYFVSHWHIPTYYIEDNPNINEMRWLDELIKLPNTPYTIKKVAQTVKDAIIPKTLFRFKDYRYLPKLRIAGEPEIPKRDLLMVREELGKVIGYRLYKESFKFFNVFFKKYERKVSTHDRYKEIELLCAVFVYEPYLYNRMKGVLPDIIEQIEDFVRVLIFREKAIYDKLTYKWDKKDIVHLFFIVFKDDDLVRELTTERFVELIEFTQPHGSALNYVLYKLSRYFPLTNSDIQNKKFDDAIRRIIFEVKSSGRIGGKELKKYYNFISTLPTKEGFNSQITKLRNAYAKQSEPEYHDERKSFNHNISYIVAIIRDVDNELLNNLPISTDNIMSIRHLWFSIHEFLIPILRFARTFPGFLTPYPYFFMIDRIEGNEDPDAPVSLREMVNFIDNVVFSLNESFVDQEKLIFFERFLIRIQSDFEVNSVFHRLIDKPESDLALFITELMESIRREKFELGDKISHLDVKGSIPIPKEYTDLLLIKELITNVKNHAVKGPSSVVELSGTIIENGGITLIIKNKIRIDELYKGNGEGSKCFKLLEEFSPFHFSYDGFEENGNFIQELNFNF